MPTDITPSTLSGPVEAAPAYDSRFDNWDTRASVRNKPRRLLDADEAAARVFFPPELVPAIDHPLVAERGAAATSRVLVQSLYQYLNFTVVLEQAAVMPVTLGISLDSYGVEFPESVLADALKITTDEAWHAQFSYDLMRQVEATTHVPLRISASPPFIRRLERIRLRFDGELRELVGLFFGIVSETLVSSILSELPNDKRLPRAVRALVGDHAEDEGRHHAYFRSLLQLTWPVLDDHHRRVLGSLVPELVETFLEPDLEGVAISLQEARLPDREIARVIEESYPKEWSTQRIAFAARATVRSFREVDALDDPQISDAFAAYGLLCAG
jgi:hypothetical protein